MVKMGVSDVVTWLSGSQQNMMGLGLAVMETPPVLQTLEQLFYNNCSEICGSSKPSAVSAAQSLSSESQPDSPSVRLDLSLGETQTNSQQSAGETGLLNMMNLRLICSSSRGRQAELQLEDL